MKVLRRFAHSVFVLMAAGFISVVLLAGCGGGGGGGHDDPPPPSAPAKVTTLQGAALVPGGGALPKPARYKPLPENGPFVGAKVEVLNLTSGISYPAAGLTLAGTVGEFKIQDVPTGHDYLVKVRKGNMVVMKVIRIPEEASNPFDIGNVDAESTSVALMLEHFIREVLGRDDFDITRTDNNVDPAELEDAVRNSDLAALESLVAELAAKIHDLEGDLEELENELAAHHGSEDGVAVVNVYTTVIQILNISNPNISNEGPDAIHDFRDNGQVGGTGVVATRVEAEFDEDGLLISISVDVNVVVSPADFLEFLEKAVPPQTTIRSGPSNPTTLTSASFVFDSSREGSTFRCKLDGEAFADCVSPKEYSGFSLGRHDFCVVAKDKEGVEDPSPACYPWVILSRPEKPDTKIDSFPLNPSSTNSATFRFYAEIEGVPLPGATFACALDSDVFESCPKTKSYTGLSEGTHIFKVKATDASGNTDDSPAQYVWTIDTTPPPTCPIFCDDFEGGLAKWSVSGSDWAIIDTDSVSVTHSVTDSPEGNFSSSTNATITMANSMNLSNMAAPVLSFWEKRDLPDCDNLAFFPRDHAVVEVSENGGITWTVLLDVTCSVTSTWFETVLDLSAYKTTPIKIRFRLIGDGDDNIGAGWSIDDVEIKEKETATLSFPFSDDFETGLPNWSVSGSDWALIDTDFVSPTRSVTDSPAGNFSQYSNAALTMEKTIDLSETTAPVLSFWEKRDLPDCDNLSFFPRDHAVVEVSGNGGITWTVLLDVTCSATSTWFETVLDLSAHKTTPIKIRFRLIGDGDDNIGAGWSIDDVEIKEPS